MTNYDKIPPYLQIPSALSAHVLSELHVLWLKTSTIPADYNAVE